jgi:hypothetical protein
MSGFDRQSLSLCTGIHHLQLGQIWVEPVAIFIDNLRLVFNIFCPGRIGQKFLWGNSPIHTQSRSLDAIGATDAS